MNGAQQSEWVISGAVQQKQLQLMTKEGRDLFQGLFQFQPLQYAQSSGQLLSFETMTNGKARVTASKRDHKPHGGMRANWNDEGHLHQ